MSGRDCLKEILLSQYLDGELPADAAKRVREHLLRCRDCGAVYEQMESGRSLLSEYLPGFIPPAHVKQQLLRRIDAAQKDRRHSGILNWVGLWEPGVFSFRARAFVAACVIILAAALSSFQIHRHLENKKILAEIDRSGAQWAARDFSLNPFDIDVQGAPLHVTRENPFNFYLGKR